MTDNEAPPMKTFSSLLEGTYAGNTTLVASWLREAYAETDQEIASWVSSLRSRGGRLPEFEVATSFHQVPRPHGTPGVVMERIAKIVRRSAGVTMLRPVDAAADED